ncbi:MAG: hypothetical protein ACTSQO_00250 [Candidatus Helarchaeota archaeon]
MNNNRKIISFVSISILRYIISICFIFIGLINILFLDSEHEAGVLFPLPYFVTTGVPPLIFGLFLLIHTIISTNFLKIENNGNEISITEKKIFTKVQTFKINEIKKIYLGNNKVKYKFVIFAIWMMYIYFTFISSFHQLNYSYQLILLSSSIVVFIINILILIYPRNKLVIENEEFRIWTKFSRGDFNKILEIMGIDQMEINRNASVYKCHNFYRFIIGLIFILISIFEIYFPFGTYIDFFSVILGIYLIISWYQNEFGNVKIHHNENLYVNYNFLGFTSNIFIKDVKKINFTKNFKYIHPFLIGFISYIGLVTVYTFIYQILIFKFSFYSLLYLAGISILIFLLIFDQTELIQYDNDRIEIPKIGAEKSHQSFWEIIIINNSVKSLYLRIAIILIIIFLPIFIQCIFFPILT